MAPPRSGGQGRPDPVLDRAIEAFDGFSSSLVHLEAHSLASVRSTVEQFALEVEEHLKSAGGSAGPGASSRPKSKLDLRLEHEHERFAGSVEQLRGLLAVVVQDDHGGHRQALGQYGRILSEALRLHRRDERPHEQVSSARRARRSRHAE